MTDTHRPSALELDLKRIVRAHPEAVVHPHSPSGPYSRAVLWTADDETIKGQVFWDTTANRWVVRAYNLEVGDSSLVVTNPASKDHISDAITEVIERVQDPALDALAAVSPTLANVVRSLRT